MKGEIHNTFDKYTPIPSPNTEIKLFLSNTDWFHSQSHFPFALWTDWHHQEGQQQVDGEFCRDCALVFMVTLDVMS